MRSRSYSNLALRVALDSARRAGAETVFLSLAEVKVPFYAPDVSEYDSKGLEIASSEVERADAFILATPDYHGSMSGVLKNFLDHYWKEFAGKLFGYVVASHEKGLTVMDHMRTAVRQCYGWSMPYGVSVSGEQDFTDGKLTNPRIELRLEMLGRDLTMYGRAIRLQFQADVAGAEKNTFASRFR